MGCWVETSPTREDGIAWLLSHSRIQSSQAIPSQWFWAAFRNFPYFLSEPSSINAPLAELVDALDSKSCGLRPRPAQARVPYGVRVRFPHGARAVNNMFSVAGHDIHGISASSSYPVFFFLFYSLAGHGSGTPFLGIVGRKKTIPSHSSPMTGIPFFPLSFGMLRLMSATKVDRGEGKPAKFP